MALAAQRWLAYSALPFATATVTLLALVLGGGTQQGFWSDVVVQLASLPLIAVLFLFSRQIWWPRGPTILVCFLVALPLAQLIPLPPTLWTALPGRDEIAQVYRAANISLPWLPISLDPEATWRSALSLLPPVAVFLAMQRIADRSRRNIVLMIMVVAFVSVLLDLLQLTRGEQSALRFYTVTNVDRAVGFFANANHNAAFLCCVIPFAAAWSIGIHRYPVRALLIMVFLGIIVIGLAVGQSRAGIILAVVAGLSCMPLVLRGGSGISRKRLLGFSAGGIVIALLLTFQFGFVGLAQRMQGNDIINDLRWPIATVTLKAIQTNLPFGTGFGTFVPVFQAVEPRELLMERNIYINRAHDDWLELGLEGGVLTLAGLLTFFAWWGYLSIRIWNPNQGGADPLDTALGRSGSIIVVLIALHSIVDYPLRTTALMTLFAVACALLSSGGRIDPYAGGNAERKSPFE